MWEEDAVLESNKGPLLTRLNVKIMFLSTMSRTKRHASN